MIGRLYVAEHLVGNGFINPFHYEQPPFHEEGMDNPDKPCKVVLTDEELLDYLDSIEKRHLIILIR